MRSLRAIAVVVLLVAVAGCSAQMEPDRTLHGSSPSNTLAAPSQTPGPVATTSGVRQTIYGRVTDVDRNEIRVKTADESFEVKMKDPKSAGIRKGDNVQIDMTFTPTSPSALPSR
jgi:hypothetical protein